MHSQDYWEHWTSRAPEGWDSRQHPTPAHAKRIGPTRWQGSAPRAWALAGLLGLLLLCLATATVAQERTGTEPLGRSGLPSLATREEQPPLPPPPPEECHQLSQQGRVLVRQINVIGNTVLPADRLAEVTHRYTNRQLVIENLETVRLALTRLYIDAGYINSGVI